MGQLVLKVLEHPAASGEHQVYKEIEYPILATIRAANRWNVMMQSAVRNAVLRRSSGDKEGIVWGPHFQVDAY
ncbi:hypothetical protein PAAL66ix_17412 [Paenibacillus alvei A6-6i-x]|nr:hypothetical protein PAAL66ix_17412 [Paenibacillus alvei A6-6i-x]